MARDRRKDYPGAWHHVVNRGADRAPLFAGGPDCQLFLWEARHAFEAFGLELHGYCLMTNHYHLLVKSNAGQISLAFQRLATRFSQQFNKRHLRDGPVFRGRFRSVEIADDAQLVATLSYVHRNPVDAGLVKRSVDWQWSSAAAYSNQAEARLDWLVTREIQSLRADVV